MENVTSHYAKCTNAIFFCEKIIHSIHHSTQDWSKLMVRIMDIHEERVWNISYDLLLLRIKKRVEAKHPGFFGLN